MNRILVVDDSEVIGSLLNDFLSSHGYEVALALTAEQAYHWLQKQTPDLILLDVQLPDVGGFEFCRMLRARAETRYIPIVIITATAVQTQDKVKGLQAGADDYVLKPFEMPELLERIRAVMRRASQRPAESLSPQAAALKSGSPPAALAKDKTLPMPVVAGMVLALSDPLSFPPSAQYPAVTLTYLVCMLALLTAGQVLAAGSGTKPLMVCLFALLAWSSVVSVVVVACSLLGIPLKWKEGGRLVSLAALPMVLKWAGGLALAAFTSISPLFFTAGPALFLKSPSVWIFRLDVFEGWSAILLAIFLNKRPTASPAKVAAVTLAACAAAAFFLNVLQGMGPP
jgi:CheY-like chemotaxis protein